MASKLDLSFSTNTPDGAHAVVCLVSDGGTLLPTLDKDQAAAVITAMSAASFNGDADKSLTLFLEAGVFVLVGIGEGVVAGSAAETVGGRILSAVDALETKRACFPEQGLDDEVMADMLMGMMSAAYHFEEYFTETTRREKTVQFTVVSSSLDEAHPAVSDRVGLMKGVEMARNLVFEPPNRLFPVEFATRCTALEKLGF